MPRLNPLVLMICAASLALTVWMAATSGTRELRYLSGPSEDAVTAVSP